MEIFAVCLTIKGKTDIRYNEVVHPRHKKQPDTEDCTALPFWINDKDALNVK